MIVLENIKQKTITKNVIKKGNKEMNPNKIDKMTFVKAAILVLEANENLPMSANEIWEQILFQNLYNNSNTSIKNIIKLLIENSINTQQFNNDNNWKHTGKNIFKIVDDNPYTFIIADENNEEYVKHIIEIYSEEIYEEWRKNKNNKIFEDAIEKMMLDKCFHEQYAPYIDEIRKVINEKIKPHKKRFAILSILDNNRNLLQKAKIHSEISISKLEHIKDLTSILRKYVKVSEVEKKKFGEVMTPLELVAEMLKTLPKEVWSNPNLKWLDPCNGTGTFLSMVVLALMKGLAEWEPDENKRYKHILENMVYACELQPKNMFLWMMGISPHGEHTLNIYTGSFLDEGFDKHMKEVWDLDKFDLIIGNPPYQEADGSGGNGSSAIPIYNLFIEKSLLQSDNLLMITPSRWFTGGKGLDKFRNMMLNRNDIRLIRHFDGNGDNVFKGVDIKGGVSYFHIDKNYKGNIKFNDIKLDNNIIREFGCLLDNKLHYDIINKINNKANKFFNNKVESCNYFGKIVNDKKTLRNAIDCVDTHNDNFVKCYVSKKEGFIKYIDVNLVNTENINKYKVFTVKGTNVGYMGNTFIGFPNEVCTETYLTILCDSEIQANNIVDYFKTNFIKYLFKLLNTTQNASKETFRLMPYLDFNIKYTDDYLYNYFELNETEIQHINNHINKI